MKLGLLPSPMNDATLTRFTRSAFHQVQRRHFIGVMVPFKITYVKFSQDSV